MSEHEWEQTWTDADGDEWGIREDAEAGRVVVANLTEDSWVTTGDLPRLASALAARAWTRIGPGTYPEPGTYLIATDRGHSGQAWYHPDDTWTWTEDGGECYVDGRVTHYQPLPVPPAAGEGRE